MFGHYRQFEGMSQEEVSAQLRMGNYERLFDTARRKVRAWEAANVR